MTEDNKPAPARSQSDSSDKPNKPEDMGLGNAPNDKAKAPADQVNPGGFPHDPARVEHPELSKKEEKERDERQNKGEGAGSTDHEGEVNPQDPSTVPPSAL